MPDTLMNFVDIQSVSKSYRNTSIPAVDEVSLKIDVGDIFGLLGPNGAGKTTLISMLCGITNPTTGIILINNKTHHTDSKECKQLIGIVPQEIALYPKLTAWENLLFLGHMHGLKGSNLKDKIQQYLKMHGLEKSKNQQIQTFSGGMKRRINLIAGILHSPKLLILDEPTVGVDIQSKQAIIDHLTQLNKSEKTTILYTSHHLDEAEEFCNKIAIIDSGKIVTTGDTHILKSQHQCNSIKNVYLKITGKNFRD